MVISSRKSHHSKPAASAFIAIYAAKLVMITIIPDPNLTTSLICPPHPFWVGSQQSLTEPNLVWCQYDITYYQPTLFSQYGVDFPLSIAQASRKRQAEYLASRWLAKRLLTEFGIANFQLKNAKDRSPIWPTGISGSLSHHVSSIFMVISTEPSLVGCDIEFWLTSKVATEIAELIANQQEIAICQAAGLDFARSVSLLFSVKEALYKALARTLPEMLDFRAVELNNVDPRLQQVQLILLEQTQREISLNYPCFTLYYNYDNQQCFCWTQLALNGFNLLDEKSYCNDKHQ